MSININKYTFCWMLSQDFIHEEPYITHAHPNLSIFTCQQQQFSSLTLKCVTYKSTPCLLKHLMDLIIRCQITTSHILPSTTNWQMTILIIQKSVSPYSKNISLLICKPELPFLWIVTMDATARRYEDCAHKVTNCLVYKYRYLNITPIFLQEKITGTRIWWWFKHMWLEMKNR